MAAAEHITPTEYARRRGCDEKAVRKAMAEGRITPFMVNGRKMLDPKVADIQWSANTRARADSAPTAQSANTRQRGEGQRASDDYNAARTRRELAEAERSEIELAKARGQLVETDRVVVAVFTAFRQLRDGGMVVGRKLASRLATMSDARDIQHAIDEEMRELFGTFGARTVPGILQAVTDAGGDISRGRDAAEGEARA